MKIDPIDKRTAEHILEIDDLETYIQKLKDEYGADVRLSITMKDGSVRILYDDAYTFRNMWRTIREVYDYPTARAWVRRRNAGMAMDRPLDNIERGIELAEMLADESW